MNNKEITMVNIDIWQLKDDDCYYHLWRKSLKKVQEMGEKVSFKNYELVYSLTVEKPYSLKDIRKELRTNPPANFDGYNVSTSDVFVVKDDTQTRVYYCQSNGFAEIFDFFHE